VKFIMWVAIAVYGIWYAQGRGWIAGNHWAAVVMIASAYLCFPFLRAYVKLYRLTAGYRKAKDTGVQK
jgi:hypothetical protein